MAEVERDAGIGAVHLGQRQQVQPEVGQQREGARFVRLVFDGDVERGVVIGHLGDGSHGIVPHPGIVALEAVVDAVLPDPDGHGRAAHLRQRIEAALGEVDGGAADLRIGMGEGAEAEAGIGIVAHGKAVQRDAVVGEDRRERLGIVCLEMVGIVEVGGIQPRHLCGPCDQVGHGGFARQADLEGVQAGGIAGTVAHGRAFGAWIAGAEPGVFHPRTPGGYLGTEEGDRGELEGTVRGGSSTLDGVSVGFREDVDHPRAGPDPCAVADACGNGIAVARQVGFRVRPDGEFDLAFDDRAPLGAVAVGGNCHVPQEGEEDDQSVVGPDHGGLHHILGERNVYAGKRRDEVGIWHDDILYRAEGVGGIGAGAG